MTLSLNLFDSSIASLVMSWPIEKLEAFEERMAIMQYCGDMPKVLAEERAFANYASITERAELVKIQHANQLAYERRKAEKQKEDVFKLIRERDQINAD